MNSTNFIKYIEAWDKNLNQFVSFIDIKDVLTNSANRLKNIEQLDLHKMPLRISFYNVKGMIVFDNRTVATGIIGEMWTMLANYLNFTIVPIWTDLPKSIKMISSNDSDVVPFMEYIERADDTLDYTTPMWSRRYNLYVPPNFHADGTWIFKLMTYDVFFSIIGIIVVFSILGVVIDKFKVGRNNSLEPSVTFCDHMFSTYATLCNQDGLLPLTIERRSLILTITRKLMASLLLTMLTSNILRLLTKQQIDMPFRDFTSLINNSNFKLVTRKGLGDTYLQLHRKSDLTRLREQNRHLFYPSRESMYANACCASSDVVIYEVDDIHQMFGENCTFVPLVDSDRVVNGVAGVAKVFPYKRALNLGILKLKEVGLDRALKLHWFLTSRTFVPSTGRQITLGQVNVIIGIYLTGVLLSIVIVVIENITFICRRQKIDSDEKSIRSKIKFIVRKHFDDGV